MMQSTKPQVVMSGVDSEYVLSELAEFLRACGYEVLELDFGKTKDCVRSMLAELSAVKTVYITSAHTSLSVRSSKIAAPLFGKLYPNYLAPIEIIPLLRPASSIFVPHDLLTPFGDTNLNELQFLDLYDHILAPILTEELESEAGPHTRIHNSGWIKYRDLPPRITPISLADASPHVTLFLTIIQHMQFKYGNRGFVDYLKPILGPNINVKLPAWKGIDEIERLIRDETGANVIPANVSSIELIQASDVVMCNSVSSVLAEANLMGKPCISLLDDEGEDASVKKRKMAKFPELIWYPYFDRNSIPAEFLAEVADHSLPKRIKPFDFKQVETLIACA